ncbi:MAG: CNNM domain-containing protein [Paludibacteraceae bacterium]|nr:CNNM domain-containing protein [Paludibacteraceae bacterium]
MLLLLVFLLSAMVISFLCSTLESVLMTTTLSYITMREGEGYVPAKRMKGYKLEPEKPLAAILSLNTIANTVGAAGVGQQANILFGSQWFGVVSAVVTLLILIFSEIIPKTFGTTYWKNLMGFTANTIHVLIIIMYPFVKLIGWLSHLFPETEEAAVSREEVLAMADVGEEEGVIEEDENKIIRNVMRLDDVKASDVMTPRVVAATAPESMTLKAYYDCDDYDHFSRIPVYSDSPEYITGYVMRDDALENLTEDHFSMTLGQIKRSLPQFSENMSIGDIFDRMLKEKSQISVVIDEYGCFQGILTLEDVIETIFGLEIIDENDQFADLQQYARERWKQRQKRFRQPLPKGQS